MTKIVPDSSVIVKWVNQDNELNLDQADRLLNDVRTGQVELLAPELAKYEVGNALIKKGVTDAQAFQIIGTVYGLPIRFVSETEELANETFQMANKVSLTYYDASFAALAKQEGAILVTANPKHQNKAVGVKVHSLSNYK